MRGVGKCLVDKRTVGKVLFGRFCFDGADETAADFQGVIGIVRLGLFFAAGLNVNGLFENDIFGGVAQFFYERINDERADACFFEGGIVGDGRKVDIIKKFGARQRN